MFVYNIRKEKYAKTLRASGVGNRWNKNDEFIIYTGSSRSLSTLELVVHRSGITIDNSYKLLVIEIDCSTDEVLEVTNKDLPKNWRTVEAYPKLQEIGSNWYQSYKHLILKVPSAVIPKEYNYLIHTKHPDFNQKVKIHEIEDYQWDKRLL
ncbi:RES family NAD+ phosphorylase [Faecalibacter rhinopitheci]|uniref:RES domain-containing protein n=1 Tax=Faecalibacter rhinopitheci TaxID=2779678 RepID=A0A8J7FN18_9FLAO|nr:RES family NAD+ phosphorylase [Faecalibacter rhinopitheci]MBF0595929.1 RES domain-containing protein [Faecalibacter rhinopitheci]